MTVSWEEKLRKTEEIAQVTDVMVSSRHSSAWEGGAGLIFADMKVCTFICDGVWLLRRDRSS